MTKGFCADCASVPEDIYDGGEAYASPSVALIVVDGDIEVSDPSIKVVGLLCWTRVCHGHGHWQGHQVPRPQDGSDAINSGADGHTLEA